MTETTCARCGAVIVRVWGRRGRPRRFCDVCRPTTAAAIVRHKRNNERKRMEKMPERIARLRRELRALESELPSQEGRP